MAAKAGETLEDIAAELYVLPPGEFTAARNARAKQVEDAALATDIRGLRKPLLAAWVVNLFARESAGRLGQALELAAELRDAQEDLDAAALRDLNRQRRALVRGLAQQAAEVASARGEKITQATTDAVEQTLNAAMFHEDAARAVASARLTRPLDPAGDPQDLVDSVAGEFESVSTEPVERPRDEVAARRERKEAERALRTAENDAEHAERESADLERKRSRADERIERLEDRIQALEADLARLKDETAQARQERADLEDAREQSRRRLDEAQDAVSAARQALDALGSD
jgi:hypothetical protein